MSDPGEIDLHPSDILAADVNLPLQSTTPGSDITTRLNLVIPGAMNEALSLTSGDGSSSGFGNGMRVVADCQKYFVDTIRSYMETPNLSGTFLRE